MTDKSDQASSSAKVDEELSNLLDSALEDFNKSEEKQVEIAKASGDHDSEEVDEEFIKQMAESFETNLTTLLNSNDNLFGAELTKDQIKQKFEEMAEAAQQVIDNPEVTDSSINFASTISQTIQGLNDGTEGIQNLSEETIFNMFGNQSEQNPFLPFMQGMMQSLLSKEVLYPSLKDIIDRFPDWMENNKNKVSNEDMERYEKQLLLMKEVCGELEKEQETDSAIVKKERFEKVLVLMQKLQDHGQPPTDLVGEVPTSFTPDPNQCSLM